MLICVPFVLVEPIRNLLVFNALSLRNVCFRIVRMLKLYKESQLSLSLLLTLYEKAISEESACNLMCTRDVTPVKESFRLKIFYTSARTDTDPNLSRELSETTKLCTIEEASSDEPMGTISPFYFPPFPKIN